MERELANPIAKVARRFQSGERLASELIIRSQPDAVHLFGVLPDATLVRVRRHKPLKEMPADVKAALRDSMLSDPDVLRELYLRPYSKLYRFLHTRRVPRWFIYLARFAELSFGVPRTEGPFCSELVAMLLAGVTRSASTKPPFAMAPIDFEHSAQFDDVECVEEIEVPPEASYRGIVAKLFEFEATNPLSPILARTHAIAEHAANYEKTGSMTLEGIQFTRPEVAKYELRKLAKWCTRVSDEFWKWHKEAPKCFATCPEGKLRNGPRLRKDSLVDKLHYGKCTDFFGCYGQNRQFQELSQIEKGFDAIQEEQISEFLNLNSRA